MNDTEDESEEENSKKNNELIGWHVAKLMEHFDCVRIFACKDHTYEGFTRSYDRGGGPLEWQKGMIKDWMEFQDELNRRRAHEDNDE